MDDQALCVGNPGPWFDTSAGAYASAIQTCRRCPIVIACGLQALKEEKGYPLAYRHGVRGAMTPAMRFHNEQMRTSS